VPQPADIAHLLRRAGFGGTATEIAALATQPLETTVDALLDFSTAPADVEPPFLTDASLGDWEKLFRLQAWWLDRMCTTSTPLQEKLTLFWHGHFATSNEKVNDARLMYLQNALFRSSASGSFRNLVQQMSLQPAMLIWLDNDPNEKGRPNENFARELMELFLLGVNQYTQDDVVASARAWTGHNTLDADRTQYHFYASRHDTGDKTFMGVTRNWDGPEIVDFLLRDDPARKRVAARFIATKVWSFFAAPKPSTAVVDAISNEFYDNDLDVRALVRAVFLHPEFMAPASRQGLVRAPSEWVVACMRALNFTAVDSNPQWWMGDMGQTLFEPPNVSGWRQNAFWLTTSRVWARANWARYVTWHANEAGILSDTRNLAPADAVQRAFDLFGIDTPSAETRARLVSWHTAQRADSVAWRDWRFINLVTLVMLCPEMNLA
jgi:uncharacterized protein (DUF1800 family)